MGHTSRSSHTHIRINHLKPNDQPQHAADFVLVHNLISTNHQPSVARAWGQAAILCRVFNGIPLEQGSGVGGFGSDSRAIDSPSTSILLLFSSVASTYRGIMQARPRYYRHCSQTLSRALWGKCRRAPVMLGLMLGPADIILAMTLSLSRKGPSVAATSLILHPTSSKITPLNLSAHLPQSAQPISALLHQISDWSANLAKGHPTVPASASA